MRRAAALLALLSVCGCGGREGGSAEEFLPDLVQVRPSALQVVKTEEGWRLAFLSSVENEGVGPMLLVGRRASRSAPAMSVTQLVRRTDGTTASYPVQGVIRFVQSETHRHWHYLGFERYDILTPARGPVGADRKTGFCLGDRYNARASVRITGEPPGPVWTQECGRSQPERLVIRQGISPGYGDDYVPVLEGQSVSLAGLPAGRYVLRHRVNIYRQLRESDYDNNAATQAFDLTWSKTGTPRVDPVYQG